MEGSPGVLRWTLPASAPGSHWSTAASTTVGQELSPALLDAGGAEIVSSTAHPLGRLALGGLGLEAGDDGIRVGPVTEGAVRYGLEGTEIVILVTDGEGTCDGDAAAAVELLAAERVNAQVNVVGFALDDEALTSTFRRWARHGNGTNFGATNAEELDAAMARAVRAASRVEDAEGDLVARGTGDGSSVGSAAGTYRVVVLTDRGTVYEEAVVEPEGKVKPTVGEPPEWARRGSRTPAGRPNAVRAPTDRIDPGPEVAPPDLGGWLPVRLLVTVGSRVARSQAERAGAASDDGWTCRRPLYLTSGERDDRSTVVEGRGGDLRDGGPVLPCLEGNSPRAPRFDVHGGPGRRHPRDGRPSSEPGGR